MIKVHPSTHPDLYLDYAKCQDFLDGIDKTDYKYPADITYFHVYTEVNSDKELLSIKSYLATQDLTSTKLIVWSDYDISEQENMKPFKDYVCFQVYSPATAIGTPLEGRMEYLQPADDDRHWMNSGVLRFLALYMYGGVYMDMDMVLLRDFRPILGQDFAYQWGSSTDFRKERGDYGPCAAMVGAKKGGAFIEKCVSQILKTPVRVRTTCFDEELLAAIYDEDLFTVFPSPFFNTEWLMSKTDPEFGREVEDCWFEKAIPYRPSLFLSSFAWHWHNSSNKHKEVVKGSKFNMLDVMTDKRLKDRGIL